MIESEWCLQGAQGWCGGDRRGSGESHLTEARVCEDRVGCARELSLILTTLGDSWVFSSLKGTFELQEDCSGSWWGFAGRREKLAFWSLVGTLAVPQGTWGPGMAADRATVRGRAGGPARGQGVHPQALKASRQELWSGTNCYRPHFGVKA